MERSETLGELATALALAQGEFEAVQKDSENPFHQSRYAGLSSVLKAIRPALAKNGLSIVQIPSATGPVVTVKTVLLHKSGEFIAGDLSMVLASGSPQAVGGGVTYARRYGVQAITGVAPEDDDAETAEGRGKGQTKAQMKAEQDSVRDAKLAKAKGAGLTKAVPPPLPPFPPDQGLGVGPHDITLEDRLTASVKVAQKKEPFKDMLDSFGHLKEQCLQLGRLNIYYDALEAYGVKHANQFKDFEQARSCYKLLAQMVSDAKGMQGPSPEQEAAEERQAMREQ